MVEPYNVLVLGGGIAEHALASVLAAEGVAVYAVARDPNPGIAEDSIELATVDPTDVEAVSEAVDGWDRVFAFAVSPRPEPARSGVVDHLLAEGIDVACPGRDAARIGLDRAWMRRTMEKQGYGGNHRWSVFEEADGLEERIETLGDVAVRPVGPSRLSTRVFGPEGVVAAVDHAVRILDADAGGRVLVEEALAGEAFTLAGITNGHAVHAFPPVGIHREAFGAGFWNARHPVAAYTGPGTNLPGLYDVDRESAERRIDVLVRGLARQGALYRGPITCEFVLTADGPRLVDVDAGWPDPVMAALAPRLGAGLRESLYQVATVSRAFAALQWDDAASVAALVRANPEPRDGGEPEPITFERAPIEDIRARVYHGPGEVVDGGVSPLVSPAFALSARGETLAEAADGVDRAAKHAAVSEYVTGVVSGEAYFEERADRVRAARTNRSEGDRP